MLARQLNANDSFNKLNEKNIFFFKKRKLNNYLAYCSLVLDKAQKPVVERLHLHSVDTHYSYPSMLNLNQAVEMNLVNLMSLCDLRLKQKKTKDFNINLSTILAMATFISLIALKIPGDGADGGFGVFFFEPASTC